MAVRQPDGYVDASSEIEQLLLCVVSQQRDSDYVFD